MDDFKKLTEQLMKIYSNAESVNDLGIENYFDENISLIGTGKHELFANLHEFLESFKFDVKRRGKIRIEVQNLHQIEERLDDDHVLAHGTVDFVGLFKDGSICFKMETRFTIIYKWTNGKWLVQHLHQSTPDLEQMDGEEFPVTLGKQVKKTRQAFHALGTAYYLILRLDLKTKRVELVKKTRKMKDGKKYHSNSRSYYEDVRKTSDALCLKYGLSVIEPKNGKGKSYAQWMAEQDGKPTWRTSIRLDIRDAVAESFTWKQFLEQMKQRGYQWKLNRKYIALKAPGMERYIRLRSLGKHYSEESIRQWILQPKSRIPAGKEGDSRFPKKKLKGIQALYYSYLYQMGALKQKPKRISPVLRADIRKLDARIEQMEFLQKHQITTREELLAYRTSLEERVQALTKERKRLYRSEPDSVRIGQITEELKPLRKDIRICIRIEQQSQEMEEKMRLAEQIQRQEEEQTEKNRKPRTESR